MRLHRFIGRFKLKVGGLKLEDKELLNQLRNVLKLRIGERIILCDGQRSEGLAEIREYGRNFTGVEVIEISKNKNEPGRQVVLYCSILKRENFELVVQKATEIGVKEIAPIITERTVKLSIRQDRLEKIIKEAAEQSERGIVPILHEPIDLEKAVSNAVGNKLNCFFDQSGQMYRHRKSDNGLAMSKEGVGVWIGPEGGWSPRELEMAGDARFEIISLGKTTLRAETAAIIGAYLVIHNP